MSFSPDDVDASSVHSPPRRQLRLGGRMSIQLALAAALVGAMHWWLPLAAAEPALARRLCRWFFVVAPVNPFFRGWDNPCWVLVIALVLFAFVCLLLVALGAEQAKVPAPLWSATPFFACQAAVAILLAFVGGESALRAALAGGTVAALASLELALPGQWRQGNSVAIMAGITASELLVAICLQICSGC